MRSIDAADDKFGIHATDAEAKTLREIQRLKASGEITSDAGETRYLYLLRQLRHSRVVREQSNAAKRRRGAR
jgi:hypothetical protein